MKILAILFFTFALLVGMFQSCGRLSDDSKPTCCSRPIVPSDPAFDSYVREFEYYSGRNAKLTPIYFAKLEEGTAGVCHYFRIGGGPIRWGYIEIDKQEWKYISEFQKINLIFHELGHCILGRDHTPKEYAPLMCPPSFMHYMIMSTSCIQNNYDVYLKEMFPDWSE